ncbi:putative cytochrome b5 [Drechslerella stenobrocha 248]|uniref:Putative cytochrome b5 n=1 Tax=Drechslerella stenobrocha 248 TaxID=1043628 RepID=W7IBU8_9PEZI|nr:putative cytochrome b5 [Drechslerella stenobrocha 248]
MADKQFTAADVATHKTADNGMYIIIDNGVYDITNFVSEHPGGQKILQRVAGKDATKQFWKYHSEGVLKKYAPKLQVGSLKEESKL